MFLLQLAINHTVVMETLHDHETNAVTGTQLSASSPDEEAFVLASQHFGYRFINRHKDLVDLEINGKPRQYRVVAILPYTQMRKMMSIIVEDLEVCGLRRGPDSLLLLYLLLAGCRKRG
jgi:magnesium-transporting ATPase (P-type)